MTDPIRAALERAARELELSAIALRQSDLETFAERAQNEAHAARAALAKPLPPKVGHIQRLADIIEECQPTILKGITVFAQAILSHPDIGLVLANSDGPAVPESREPASVAGELSDEEFRQLFCDIFDLRCDPASTGPVPVKFARAVLARWGHQPARLRNCPTHGQQPPQAWGCPECVRQLREELAAARLHQPATPLEVKGASDKELLQIAGHAACIDNIQESWEEMLPIELTATEILSICRAVLARWGHQPAPPAEGEVGELLAWLNDASDQATDAGWDGDATNLTRCRKVLQQQESEINRLRAQQAPVPVSERLPGPKDCDAEGRCWWWRTDDADEWWELLCISDAREYNAGCGNARYTHWLPATALPLPLPQGEVK